MARSTPQPVHSTTPTMTSRRWLKLHPPPLEGDESKARLRRVDPGFLDSDAAPTAITCRTTPGGASRGPLAATDADLLREIGRRDGGRGDGDGEEKMAGLNSAREGEGDL
jgi:hypothetical protein